MKILSLVYYFRKTVLYFTLTAGNALNIFSKMGFDHNCLNWSATPCRSPVTREKCVFHMEKVVIFHTNYDQLGQSANSQSSHSMPEWELHLAIARDSNQSGNTYFSLVTGGHKGVANQSSPVWLGAFPIMLAHTCTSLIHWGVYYEVRATHLGSLCVSEHDKSKTPLGDNKHHSHGYQLCLPTLT